MSHFTLHHIGADDNEMQIEYQEWQLKESS